MKIGIRVTSHFARFAIAALFALTTFSSLRTAESETTQPAPKAMLTVVAVAPMMRQWPEAVPANGWLAPWQEAVIASEIAGLKITDILVDVGARVKKGDELLRLSQESVQADLNKQQAAVETARANLAQARSNADRARKVRGTGAMSEQEVNEYLISEETAQANVNSEIAALESQKIRMAQTKVYAIDDGIITARSATLGAVVSQGTELFTMIRQGRIEWQAEVAPQHVGRLHAGLKARIALPDGRDIDGVVRMIGPTISKETGRTTIYVDLPAEAVPSVGLNVSGEIELELKPAQTLPESTLVYRDGMTYLFTIGDESRVTRIKVETGRRQDGEVEILSALADKAQVVLSGGAFLSDNAQVRVVAEGEAAQ